MELKGQISIWNYVQKNKIDKPIRLITLFSGYDSQALALRYLGVQFEHYRTCEWAVPSIQALKDLHFGGDENDYSETLSDLEIVDYLEGRISMDYSKPMTRAQIMRKGEKWRRKVFNNMKSGRNIGSIVKAKAEDFDIVDTDKYAYIMTYSFPCQDLSVAGKMKGMKRGMGTRSGMLWEVERILKECKELPQVLIMENVPQVVGEKNKDDFAEWLLALDSLGYSSKWGILNAKDFGIAQNRKRCFMVSVLGDCMFEMPTGFSLGHRLKDFLDKKVDERYYLRDQVIKSLNLHKERNKKKGNGFGWCPTTGGGIAHTITTEAGYRQNGNFIINNGDNDKRNQSNLQK